MSNAATLTLGAGAGLGLWYLWHRKGHAVAAHAPTHAPTTAPSDAAAPRACVLRLDTSGLTADGARVTVAQAVARCQAAGRADVTVVPGAPAATYGDLMVALGRAGIPTTAHRNARGRRRGPARRGAHTPSKSSTFTLVVFPEGIWGRTKRVRYFRADPPTTWQEARGRLAQAGLLDRNVLSPNDAGAWRLITDPDRFRADLAEPLPGGSRG
jgi:hypothetical protein